MFKFIEKEMQSTESKYIQEQHEEKEYQRENYASQSPRPWEPETQVADVRGYKNIDQKNVNYNNNINQ